MKPTFTATRIRVIVLALIACFSTITGISQILGTYTFTGSSGASCPNTNNSVTTQPANAVFSTFTNVNGVCVSSNTSYNNKGWSNAGVYNRFTITPNAGYGLNLTSISFSHVTDRSADGWELRSSVDNYASVLGSGTVSQLIQTPTINLPAGSFTSVDAVTFRIYLINPQGSQTEWSNDNVTLYGTVNLLPANPGNPTSNSPQCSLPGVTLLTSGITPLGETWYWQTSATGRSTANSAPTYTVSTSGTYYLRSQNNSTLAWSSGAGSAAVVITADVPTPTFALGTSSLRCQSAGTVTYTADASPNTGISYSLDATSIAAGNSIDPATGAVTFDAAWVGNSVITATATGCAGPKSANHTVTTNAAVTTPVFSSGGSSVRCQGAGTVTYSATADHTSGITYTLDAASITGGNSINAATGAVTYSALWNGTTIITARAAGCFGPQNSTHTVTITPTIGTPVFSSGATSSHCQAAGAVIYSATSTDFTALTYSLNAASLSAGNSIDANTGEVTYMAGYSGTTIITASATGCNGPKTATHTVTVNPAVGTPVFTLGSSSTRCQAAGSVSYTATATTNTGITYSLDGSSIAAGNSINTFNGTVTFVSGWSGSSVITATATGCYGPSTSNHTVTITPIVTVPVFDLGSTSTRCQGSGTVTYNATSNNTTGVTYTLDLTSRNAGNTINASTGAVTYTAGWSGTSTITATAAGCSPLSANHTVTITPTVGTPIFSLGVSSNRCIGVGTITYTATATTNTGITYSLDATSIAGNNSINPATGAVTYDAAWTGVSTITATATGCNGPKSSNHTVTTNGLVQTPVFSLGSASSRCQGGANVSYSATATNTSGITYALDATTDAYSGNSINSTTGVVTFASGWTGTSTVTASAAGCSGPKTAVHTITTIPTVGTPVFSLGSSSSRCQAAGTVMYDATATTNTGISYSLDATSTAAGNSINTATGEVTYAAGWTGASIITCSATGCNGPKTSTHQAITNGPVSTPVFAEGSSAVRCQTTDNQDRRYEVNASADNATSLVYSWDATTDAFPGNSLNPNNGKGIFDDAWSGTTIITVTAYGCYGPKTATHTITTTGLLTTPVFALGNSSGRCAGAATITYTATSPNAASITYSLDGSSLSAGNTINATTGAVTYTAGYSGSSTITATATGCNGPKTASHTVTITPNVTTPVFSSGATSARCQAAGSVTYAATASNTTGITYTLDAASITGGNSINSATGAVTYLAGWSGTSIITASAAGCSGPKTATHTVTINALVTTPVFDLGSSTTRCQGSGSVTYHATSNNTTGITYTLDLTSRNAGNTINSSTGAVTYVLGWSGVSTITATAAGCTPQSSTHTATITATVGTPVFALGSSSSRCQAAGTVTYSATASNNTGISYSLDASSIAAGNSIDANTGLVSFVAGWSGSSTITVTANGCNGPSTSTHTVTTTGIVATPAFTAGATTVRCQGSGTVTYTATANNTTGITYTLDATTAAYTGNSINASTGAVTYASGWSGTTTITASAAGCSGPKTATHTVTVTPTVSTPVFASGATSTRCQGATTVNYGATASNSTGITYSLNSSSSLAGNTINASTGDVTYITSYNGTTIITATAAGCNGPKTATHTVTVTASVGTPIFASGASSTRCQAAGSVTYSATATTNTGLVYSLDAASITGGNTINSTTGAVSFAAGWNGTTVITATASGCNGPTSSSHTVTVTSTVGTPIFDDGATSTRCQGAGTVTYNATASNTTGITYTLDLTSRNAGNTISSNTGDVTYVAGWSGVSTITATAAGCTPQSATHTVTITPTVGTPSFTSGATSTRCQASGTVTYSATASNTTGIVYSLDATTAAFAGNSINSATGAVTYAAGWSGSTVITATASGCNGPKTATHTVTVTGVVANPVFALGATSTRCQSSGTVTYSATSTNSTGITYALDATTAAFAGNSINSSTGAVTFASGWNGTSVITATSTGCSGPKTSTHTITTSGFVSTPVFSLGATSIRCQGAATVTYTATATNTTGITYTLDNASISGGNSIDAATGVVTFAATWSGTTIISANAAGCNGPKAATHTVTVTTSVGVPAFQAGAISTRLQAADAITYTANATNTTGIKYYLDSASLANGNTIDSISGTVIFKDTWSGVTTITAKAAGCNGPAIGTHIVIINPNIVTTPLYLSEPGQSLDRIDPVASNDLTTATTVSIKSGNGSHNHPTESFVQQVPMCAPLVIKAKPIVVTTYIAVTSGTIGTYPNVTATLKYGTNTIIALSNPIYNSATGILTWMGTLGADVTVPSGQGISLVIYNYQDDGFTIQYDSRTKPSRIELPVSSYINIESLDVYDAPYPNGNIRTATAPGNNNYVRAVVSDPFGGNDITGLNIAIQPTGNNGPATAVDSSGCTKTYEYMWTSTNVPGQYTISATSLQGLENKVTFVDNVNLYVCTTCPPVAVNDSASGAGGAPVLIDVLRNDYDPNNNMNPSSLLVIDQPTNGDAIISNGQIVYIPNGTFSGLDTFSYQICDLSSPVALCDTAIVVVKIDPTVVDPCTEATQSHTFYIPYPEQDARTALIASQNTGLTISNIRTVISLKMPYPGMTVVWDHWEDGYEVSPLNPTQTTTKVWGDGNPYNGTAPGYPDDIIPAGGGIVLDNTIPCNPRVAANIFYDGKDKIFASGQISVTQVCGEPSAISVQCMKTDVASTADFGKSFTVPVGQDFPSQDFAYTALFIRASEDNTIVSIDKDNNGTFETVSTMSQGQSLLVNGGVRSGARITSSNPVGVDVHFAGVDNFSSREVPLYPASWYSNIYYTPVPTTGASTTIKDTNAVYLYNNLNRPITINWSSGIPSSGSILLPPKTVKRFALAMSTTAAYKFVNPTGESFTAIQVCDSYTPGGGGNPGSTYDWAFNLIAEARLTTFATTAWAPGSTDGSRNDNPIWVTPSANTTIYVKYNGDLTNGGSVSPNGLHYDVSYPLNVLKHKRLLDPNDNDQSGLAVYTVDGTKLAVVYGTDASTANVANPSWDVGSTIRPYCAMKLIFANDDYAFTLTDNPVTISILKNDYGFSSVVNPGTVSTAGMLQPKHGIVTVNPNGTILYTPDPGYLGMDTLEYSVCSTPSPVVCDRATVFVRITSCPTPLNQNIVAGQVFLDQSQDGLNNDGGTGFSPATVHIYMDGNCNGVVDPYELEDSVMVDNSGMYQFIMYPEKTIADDFDGVTPGTRSCANGTNGNTPWATNWTDGGDVSSVGFCVAPPASVANTDVEITKDGTFGYALRLKDNDVSATRTANLTGATAAFLSFSYRRATTAITATEDLLVQASKDGVAWSTIYTIEGDGTKDLSYVNIWNQDITAYAAGSTYIRFLTNTNFDDADSVFIDNVSIKFLKYPACYITKLTSSSVPDFYYMTTPSNRALSISGSGSCYSPYDFGLAPLFGVLPVVDMPLKGTGKENENLLDWSTETEIESDHFEVQNSTDGTNFTSIASVNAKGNSSMKSYYSYSHRNPSKVLNFYRIKLVAKDGKVSYSNTVKIKPGSKPVQMTVMPNPFDNDFTVAAKFNFSGKAVLSIVDMYGKTVKVMNVNITQGYNTIRVNDLGSLPSGTYVVQIKSEEEKAFSKIVKMK